MVQEGLQKGMQARENSSWRHTPIGGGKKRCEKCREDDKQFLVLNAEARHHRRHFFTRIGPGVSAYTGMAIVRSDF